MPNPDPPQPIGNPLVDAAKRHPLYSACALILLIVNGILYYRGVVTDPIVVFGGVALVLILFVMLGATEHSYEALRKGKGGAGKLPLWLLTWVVYLVTMAILIALTVAFILRLFPSGATPPAPVHASTSIELKAVTRLKDTGLFDLPSTLDTTSPVYQTLVTMNQFVEDLEAAASPPSEFDGQRVVFAASLPTFDPPYQSMSGFVRVPPFEVVQGYAFLVSEGEGNPPVRLFRQMPFRIDTKADGAATSYINQLNIVAPVKNERLLLLLRVQALPGHDISRVESFPTTITITR